MVDLTQAEPQRSAFVGRRRELAELLEALEGGADSQRHLFLISGEPGIGKTRLVDEVAAGARDRGVRVVWGRCWEGEGAPAYWPWIQVLRASLSEVEPEQRRALLESEVTPHIAHDVAQIVPELRPALLEGPRPSATTQLDPEQARFRLFDSVTNLLKNFARSKAMLIVLDDLHDGDQASLMMLRFVARELAGASILLVGTYRDVEVRRSRPLGKLIGEISREARSIPLAGLSEAEVANFVESLAGQRFDDKLVARLYAATNGNPLFIDGIVRLLIAGGAPAASDAPFSIPGGVREAIHLRLGRLSQQTNATLSVAAAIGNEFEVRRCQLVAGFPADQVHPLLDEAAGADVVTPLGYGRYRFSHALIREALYGDIDTNTRIALHGKIGEVTEELYRDDIEPHLAELAHHFGEARSAEKAIDYSIRAADAAFTVYAYDAALSHAERALAIAESHGANTPRRAAVLFRLGAWRFHFFELARGIEDMESALRLYQQLGDKADILEAHSQLGIALAGHGLHQNLERAQRHYREATSLVSDDTDPQLVARINFGLALTSFDLARYDEALSASARSLEIYDRLGLADQGAWVHAAKDRLIHLMFAGRQAEAVALFQRIFAAANPHPDPDVFGWAMFAASLYRIHMSDPREAERLLRLGLERSGLSARNRGLLSDFLALAVLETGRVAEAGILAANSTNTMIRAFIALRKGDWQSPPGTMRETLAWARGTGNRTDQLTLLCALVDVLRVVGDHEEAASTVGEMLTIYEPGALLWEMRTRPKAALIAVDTGRPDEAAAHLDYCRKILAAGEDWLGLAGFAALAEGAVAAARGRLDAANAHFEKAVEISTQYTLPWLQEETLRYWGKALLGAGDRIQAMQKFDAAIQIYRRAGAGQPWIDQIEADQRQTQGAPINPVPGKSMATTSETVAGDAIFRHEGEFWTVAYQGTTTRFKDAKGLRYLAYLLAHPGEQIHVRDLVRFIEGQAATKGVAPRPVAGPTAG